jgi:hypothetical protein
MNKNTKARVNRARDAFGRVKHGRGSEQDQILAGTVGHSFRLSKKPKVAAGGRSPSQ